MDISATWFADHQCIFGDPYTFLSKLFSTIRIVDPENKRIVECESGKPVRQETECYSFWKQGEVCKNCVSMQALDTDEITVKVEQHTESVYWVTAVPVTTEHGRHVIELLRPVSDNTVLGEAYQGRVVDFCEMVDNINSLIVRDALTGVYNRYYIEERLPTELKYGQEKGMAVSVIMADLDKFKETNDQYGHVAGDKALCHVADLLQGAIRREGDWVARYGGEEFLVCMLGTDARTARKVAERMCETIAKKSLSIGNKKIRIKASFGVCTVGVQPMDMHAAIECADRRLYQAKQMGGNRVVDS